MATATTTDAKCFQLITSDLARISGSASPDQLFPQAGVLDAILSPENTSGFANLTAEITKFHGKDWPQDDFPTHPKFQIKYYKPSCTYTSAGSVEPDICASLTQSATPYAFLDVSTDKVAYRQWKVTLSQFDNLNETPDERLSYELIRAAREIRIEMNNVLGTLLRAQAGTYANGTSSATAPISLPLFDPAKGYFQPVAMARVKQEYLQGGYNDKPIFVGGSKTPYMGMVAQSGGYGVNNVGGSPSTFMPVYVFADMYMDGIAANNEENATSFMPGSVRLIEFFRNTGYKFFQTPTKRKAVINIGGLDYDLDMIWKDCDEFWTFTLTKRYGLFTIPQTAYDGSATCYRNLILNWYMGCGDPSCALIDTRTVVV